MDKYDYRFVLTDNELLEYYQYIVGMLPASKRKRIWIQCSVPALLLFTLVYFKLYTNWMLDVGVVLLAAVWLLFVCDSIWLYFLKRKVRTRVMDKLSTENARELAISFDSKHIKLDGKNVRYCDIQRVVPLKTTIAFFYGEKNAFVIPQHVIGSNEQIKDLYTFVLKNAEKEKKTEKETEEVNNA